MAKENALNALGEKERTLVLPLGRKRVIVYEIASGKGTGLAVVQCSLYPKLGGLFTDVETAIRRAHNIKSFHERQLEIVFTEQGKEE